MIQGPTGGYVPAENSEVEIPEGEAPEGQEPAAPPAKNARHPGNQENLRPFADRRKKAEAKIHGWRYSLDSKGRFVYNDLERLPPLEVDDNGFAVAPPKVSTTRRRCFTETERKCRFVLMYSYSCGNILLSCQEAGVPRAVYETWSKTDAVFVKCLKDALEDIGDRAHLRLMMRIGLIPQPDEIKVHDAALFGLLKKMRPNLFADGLGTADEPPGPPEPHIPRPTG